MSKPARVFLNKMQGYCPTVTYEMCDIEWYAHRYNVSVLVSWWKAKGKDKGTFGNTHTWYMPELGSEEHTRLLGYIFRISGVKVSPLEIYWTNNHKQVYYYLCSNILTCDFNINEFKTILDIGSEFNIQEVQQVADKTRGMPGGDNIAYILAALQRNKQTRDIKAQRVAEAISLSQKSLKKISSKRSTALDVMLMRMIFRDTKETQEIERLMNGIAAKNMYQKG
jgi:hypothetical protein